MLLEDKLKNICSFLKDDGFGCLFADNEPLLVCSPYSNVAYHRINSFLESDVFFEMICEDLKALINTTKKIHPRIETLLLYHTRPLKVFIKDVKQFPVNITNNGSYLRITKDKVIKSLLNKLGHPLLAFTMSGFENGFYTSQLDPYLHEKCDFVLNNNFLNGEPNIPILKINFDNEGLIRVLE